MLVLGVRIPSVQGADMCLYNVCSTSCEITLLVYTFCAGFQLSCIMSVVQVRSHCWYIPSVQVVN